MNKFLAEKRDMNERMVWAIARNASHRREIESERVKIRNLFLTLIFVLALGGVGFYFIADFSFTGYAVSEPVVVTTLNQFFPLGSEFELEGARVAVSGESVVGVFNGAETNGHLVKELRLNLQGTSINEGKHTLKVWHDGGIIYTKEVDVVDSASLDDKRDNQGRGANAEQEEGVVISNDNSADNAVIVDDNNAVIKNDAVNNARDLQQNAGEKNINNSISVESATKEWIKISSSKAERGDDIFEKTSSGFKFSTSETNGKKEILFGLASVDNVSVKEAVIDVHAVKNGNEVVSNFDYSIESVSNGVKYSANVSLPFNADVYYSVNFNFDVAETDFGFEQELEPVEGFLRHYRVYDFSDVLVKNKDKGARIEKVFDNSFRVICAENVSFADCDPLVIDYITPAPTTTYWKYNWWNINVSDSSPDDNQTYVAMDWNKSLVLWMRFENQTGENASYFMDESSYSINGTCTSNICPNLSVGLGKFGNAMDFNDSQVINIPSSNAYILNLTGKKFTITAWIKPHSFSQNDLFFGREASVWISTKFNVAGCSADNKFNFLIYDGAWACTNSTTTATAETWYYVTAIYNLSHLKLYVNGVLESTLAKANNNFNNGLGYNWSFGLPISPAGWGSNATMDEVMVYYRELDSDEINASMNSTQYRYYHNFTSLTDATYTYQAHSVNSTGAKASTSTYSVTIDTTLPTINFTYPTPNNGFYSPYNWAYINVSSTDLNDHYTILDWNRSLVLWMRFENQTGLENGTYFMDESTWSNNGTCASATCPTLNDTGKFGKRQEFVGKYIRVTDKPILNLTTEGTVSYWVKVYSFANNAYANGIWKESSLGGGGYSWGLFGAGDYSAKLQGLVQSITCSGIDITFRTTTLNTNQWYYAVLVWNQTNMSIYIDGKLNITKTSPATRCSTSFPIHIGCSNNGAAACFVNGNSTIDEIQVYSRALSSSEINASYNATSYKYYNNFTGLTDATYTYTAYSVDLAGNKNETEMRNVTIDTIFPQINLTYPLNTTYTSIQTRMNYTVSDLNLQICWFYNGTANNTMTCGTNITTNLYSNQGTNTWIVYANDTANNVNSSSVTFFVDSISPTIDYATPTDSNGAYLNRNFTLINVTSTDTNLMNISIRVYNSTGSIINVTNTTTSPNFVNISLSDGVYSFNATATDILGNKNETTTRNVTVDTVKPILNFTAPTPDTGFYSPYNWVYINVSSTDLNDHYTILDWNKTLVLWMRFENDTTRGENGTFFNDESTYSNNGTCSGTFCPVLNMTGKFGKGLEFNGSEYVQLDSATAIKTATKTASFWAKPIGTNAAAQKMIISGNNDANYFIDRLGNATSENYFHTAWKDAGGASREYAVQDGFIADSWHYYALVTNVSGNTVNHTFYRDGSVTGSFQNLLGYSANYGEPFYIGTYSTASSFWNGSIDELMIYKRALSTSEIQASYTATSNKYYANISDLADGTYTYKAYSVDLASNKWNTSERNITIDTIKPVLNFTHPTPNSSYYPANNFYVNVSSSDLNNYYTILDWNKTLRLWMRFENQSGLENATYFKDESSYSKNGSCIGGTGCPGFAQVGRFGSAVDINGNAVIINVSDSSSVNFNHSNNFTVEVWVTSDGTQGSASAVLAKTTSHALNDGYGLIVANAGTLLCFYTSSETAGACSDIGSSGAWVHVVGIWNRTTNAIYFDGVQKAITANTVNWAAITAPFVIGRGSQSASASSWDGKIDEVKVYNRILSSSEINASRGASRYYNNFTGLADSPYTFKGYAVDLAGNLQNTSERNVTIDITKPLINFTYPTPYNYSHTNVNYVTVNLTVTDVNQLSTFVDWNRTLVSWYRMGDNAQDDVANYITIDEMGIYNTSNAGWDPVMTQDGKFGKAYAFSSWDTNYFNIDGDPLYNQGNATIEAWFKPASYTADARQGIYGSGYSGSSTYAMSIAYSNYNLSCYFANNIVNGTTAINDTNKWYHLACVYNGSNVIAYVNGMQEGIAAANGNLLDITGYSVLLGGYYYGTANGTIDNVRIWKRALSANEINSSYNTQMYNYTNTFTNLLDGNYTFKGYTEDLAGNTNSTEHRVVTVDLTMPKVQVLAPLNNPMYYLADYVLLKVNATDLNINTTAVKANVTIPNYITEQVTLNNDGGGIYSLNYYSPYYYEGLYNFTFQVSDLSGNTVLNLSNFTKYNTQPENPLITEILPKTIELGNNGTYFMRLIYRHDVPQYAQNYSNITMSIYSTSSVASALMTINTTNMTAIDLSSYLYNFNSSTFGAGNYMAITSVNSSTNPGQVWKSTDGFVINSENVLRYYTLEASGTLYLQSQNITIHALFMDNNKAPVTGASCNVSMIDENLTIILNEQAMTEKAIAGMSHYIYQQSNFTAIKNATETGKFIGHVKCSKSGKTLYALVDFQIMRFDTDIIAQINSTKSYLEDMLNKQNEFTNEEIFLITDSVNSINNIARQFENGEISGEEALKRVEDVKANLKAKLGNRFSSEQEIIPKAGLTGFIESVGIKNSGSLGYGLLGIMALAAIISIYLRVRKKKEWF